MLRINTKILIILTAILCYPATLWATRGAEDYGIIMALMAFFFLLPVGLMLLGFIIYSITKLKSKEKLNKKQGEIVFTLSLIIIVPSIIIPILWVYWAENHYKMFELMSGVFIPIILLSIISSVLAMFVKKRSLNIDNDMSEVRAFESEQSETFDKRLSKKFIIGLILFLIVLIVTIFLYCFTPYLK